VTREAATGNALSPTVDTRVDGMISGAVDDDALALHHSGAETNLKVERRTGPSQSAGNFLGRAPPLSWL